MNPNLTGVEIVAQTAFLALVQKDGWQYATRVKGLGAVAIAARTEENELLLVEQTRIPLGCRVIELPAGLFADNGPEETLEAARRELIEETGYEAGRILPFGAPIPSSPGLTDETTQVFAACDLTKISDNLGVEGEQIILHKIALENLIPWAFEQQAAGKLVAPKVFAAATILNFCFPR